MKIAVAPVLLASLVAGACSNDPDYSSTTAPVGACGEVETHVVGIYDNHGETVDIHIDRPGKHNVVVSAYAKTKWRINASNGAQVEKVYAIGYHEQLVAVPRGTKLVKDSFDTTGLYACGFTAGSKEGCDSEQLLSLASKMIHHVSSFHGCASATSFTVGENLATTANCTGTTQYDSIAGCIAYMNGENSCGNGDDQPPSDPDGGDDTCIECPNDGSGDAGPVFL